MIGFGLLQVRNIGRGEQPQCNMRPSPQHDQPESLLALLVLALAPHHSLLPHALLAGDDDFLHRGQALQGQVPLPRGKSAGETLEAVSTLLVVFPKL